MTSPASGVRRKILLEPGVLVICHQGGDLLSEVWMLDESKHFLTLTM